MNPRSIISQRIALTRAACEFCPHNLGFDGPSGRRASIVRCARSRKLRVSLAAEKCPLDPPRWDATNLEAPPVIDAVQSRTTDRPRALPPTAVQGVGAGRVLVIVANGPSHREAALDRLKHVDNIDLLSINKPDPRIWPTTYWCMCDQNQIDDHRNLWREYIGTILAGSAVGSTTARTVRFRVTRDRDRFEFDLQRRSVPNGLTTTFVAMQIAIWMNYDRVYVFGLDMGRGPNGNLYAWGENPRVGGLQRERKFAEEATSFQWMADHVSPAILKRFTLCSSYNIWPFTGAFENLPHLEAVDEILRRHSTVTPGTIAA